MTTKREIRVGVLGCGFWSQFQIAGWQQLPGVRVVAAWNRTRGKADVMAGRFGIPKVYDTPEQLLDREAIDVADVITDVGSHAKLTKMIADRGVPVICQKPMAPTPDAAKEMVAYCESRNVPLFIHENWRWQTPVRQFKSVLAAGVIGPVFRARIDFATGFAVFDNQPFLKELEQFILTDIGSHILDTARFLFGEATSLYCRTGKVHRDIRGEDVATVMMEMGKATVTCNMSYAGNAYEHDRFPETYMFAEGELGTAELGPDYRLKVTTREGTTVSRVAPEHYAWADRQYDVVHASIVPCNANLLGALRGEQEAETTGQDNLKTVKLVFAAYDSAASGQAIRF